MFRDNLPTLFAQDATQYNRGLSIVQWGMTAVGVGMLVVAAGVLLSKPKPNGSGLPTAIQRVVGSILVVAALAIIAYAWLGFSPM